MEENYIEIPLIGQKKKTYKNGDVYEGSFVNGKREGKGTYIFKNGDKYEGEFKAGMKDGYGKYSYSNGNVYEGNWKDDEKNGQGVYYFLTHNDFEELRTKEITKVCNIYKGDFKDGKFEGNGIVTFKNGDIELIYDVIGILLFIFFIYFDIFIGVITTMAVNF